MKETPLMFTTDNVIRIARGLKTQTRRVDKLANELATAYDHCWVQLDKTKRLWLFKGRSRISDLIETFVLQCRYGGVGDQIWVKETYYTFESGGEAVLYKANLAWEKGRITPADGWKSAMFMPKRMARIWLTISELPRLERLQDISVEDIFAEGLESAVAIGKNGWDSPVDWYKKEWDRLNKKRGYGWDTNPYVWVITHNAFGVRLK